MKSFRDIFCAIVYFFRQSAKMLSIGYKDVNGATFGGNLDPYYLVGIMNFYEIFRKKEKLIEFVKYVLPLVFIALIQIFFLDNLNVSRFLINFIKIVICISCMLYAKNTKSKFNVFEVCKFFTLLEVVFLIVAFIFPNSAILWRLNDYTNGLDLRRLQLFYLEPSELGFHISIIVIVLLSIIFNDNHKEYRKKSLVYILINLVVLYFAKSMGAIAILFVTAVVMAFIYLVRKKSKKYTMMLVAFVFVLLTGLIIFFNSNNSIATRVLNTFNGTDNSVNYRVDVSLAVFGESLKDYNYIGCGLGNVNTPEFIGKYHYLKLDQMIVNSFVYFWTETGIFGMIYWLTLMIILIWKTRKSKSILKYGLLLYMLAYQFVGSYFTNGLIWIIYGFIISEKSENDIIEQNIL